MAGRTALPNTSTPCQPTVQIPKENLSAMVGTKASSLTCRSFLPARMVACDYRLPACRILAQRRVLVPGRPPCRPSGALGGGPHRPRRGLPGAGQRPGGLAGGAQRHVLLGRGHAHRGAEDARGQPGILPRTSRRRLFFPLALLDAVLGELGGGAQRARPGSPPRWPGPGSAGSRCGWSGRAGHRGRVSGRSGVRSPSKYGSRARPPALGSADSASAGKLVQAGTEQGRHRGQDQAGG